QHYGHPVVAAKSHPVEGGDGFLYMAAKPRVGKRLAPRCSYSDSLVTSGSEELCDGKSICHGSGVSRECSLAMNGAR
ncbi:MAG: hypothetical protein OEU52_17190, partial [Xanthomonadales bacterium]|nr:hypothetical protein [Xanthomonadales bacterium]